MGNGNKINKEQFLSLVSDRLTRMSDTVTQDGPMFVCSLEDVYEAMIAEMFELVSKGHRVSLTGIGSFYAQLHKGHPVQFGGKVDAVSSYRVFKFSASNVLNRRLRDAGAGK